MFVKKTIVLFLLFLSVIYIKPKNAHCKINQLENGFQYILKKESSVPLIVMQLWVKHGSSDETDDEAGYAHFLEHLTFRSKDIAKRIEDLGGDINAYTSLDRTVYYLTIPKEYYDVGLSVLYDIFANTSFDEKSFEEEKKVILEEMKRGYDNPQRMLYQKFFETAFERHPARRPVIGYEETIKNATIGKVKNFYEKNYTPKSSFLIVVGDFQEEKIEEKIKKLFGSKVNIGNLEQKIEKIEETYISPKFSYKVMPINSCYAMIGLPVTDIYSPYVAPNDVLSYLMGESQNSILNIRLKEEKQLVNSIYSYQMNTKDFGFFVVQANMACENLDEAVKEIMKVLFTDVLNLDTSKLKKVLRNYESNYYFSKEKLSERASDIGSSFYYFGDPEYSKKYMELINKVTLDDLNNVRSLFFVPEKLISSFIIPDSEKDRVNKISEIIKSQKHSKNEIESFKLKNGLQVFINRRSNVPTFGISIINLAGTRLETKDTSGLSNFTIANLLRGTKNYKYTEIIEKIENMGGSLTGISTKNISGIKGKFLTKDFYDALYLVSEIIKNFDPPADEIEKTRKLIIADIKRKSENPNRLLRDLYFKSIFGDMPPGLPTEGVEDTVTKFKREEIIRHFKKIFSPQSLVMVLTGDIPNDAISYIEKNFSDIEVIDRQYCLIFKPRPEKYYVLEDYDFNQSHIMIGIPVPGMVSKENVYFQLLATILSNQSGRLFVNLRDKQGLAYALGAFLYDFPEKSLFTLYMGTSPQNTERAISAMIKELKSIIEEGFTDEELEKAKRKLLTDLIEASQGNLDYASLLSQNALIHNDVMYHKTYEDILKKVDKSELIEIAKKYILVDKLVKVIIYGKNKGDTK
ncbi:MAG: insulinase family protein [Proteobacteria bacterium]|nr:insulinase family protein [Pseudomonadota bacterium]